MAKPKVGILVDETGVTSVALLANDHPGRQEALRIYVAIQSAVDTFSLQVLERLVRDEAEPEARPELRAELEAARRGTPRRVR